MQKMPSSSGRPRKPNEEDSVVSKWDIRDMQHACRGLCLREVVPSRMKWATSTLLQKKESNDGDDTLLVSPTQPVRC